MAPQKHQHYNAHTKENDFTFSRSQEVVVQSGLPMTMPISPQKGSKSWIKVAHWEPEDHTDYALDPPSEVSNDDLWQKSIYPDEGIVPKPQAPSKRKKRSLQSQWKDGQFIEQSLKSLGLPIVLMHQSLSCTNPRPCHKQFRVLHTNGMHEVNMWFCGCKQGQNVADHIQLLRRGFYPSSQGNGQIKTIATFRYLELLHHLMLSTKASTYNFYWGLCKITDASGLTKHPWRYCALVRMVLQWCHLKLLKQCGRGHDPTGVAGTANGELVVKCPLCPHPGINLPKGWESDKKNTDLYALRVAMDANFHLKEQLVSSHSRDPGLNNGKGYFVPQEPYEQYVLSLASEEDISTCVGFQAIIKATTQFSKGLQYTGVAAVGCVRGEMWLPNRAGSMQKGERYANIDYVFVSVVRQYLGIWLVIVSYDIVCQWFIHLFDRMQNQWRPDMRPPGGTSFIPVIGKFHKPAHLTENHEQFCALVIMLMGMLDFELMEHLWGVHNVLGNATKSMGPGTRIDMLEAHFGFHNWEKYIGHGETLWQKYKDSIQDRNRQQEAHESFMNSLPEELVKKWEALFKKWDSAPHPKDKDINPWKTSEEFLLEAEVEQELAFEDAQRLRDRKHAPLHKTRAAKFVKYSLDIEENQEKLSKDLEMFKKSLQTGRVSKLLLDKKLPTAHESDTNPEEAKIWLPSSLTAEERARVCTEGLCDMEIRLHKAHCHDALQGLQGRGTQDVLGKSLMAYTIEPRDGQIVISRNHSSLLELLEPGDWETALRPLLNSDVRSYMDVEKKKGRGRQGMNEEDGEENSMDVILEEEEQDMSLFSEERDRQRRYWPIPMHNLMDMADLCEWVRSRAQMARALEEVRYVWEDMRWTVELMEHKAEWWVKQDEQRSGKSKALQEGLKAYALKQAAIQKGLKQMCIDVWKRSLDSKDHTEDAADTDMRMKLGVPIAGGDRDEQEEDEEDEEDEGVGSCDADDGEDLGWA
ncbi:hypothetical protein BT96DRAFT_990028 [Gymnopus androsaceus JB14]|uniref:CxC2-like cysteine cluster KDZ transposase-associated domain-containing protein n=1 Tax=Gymnopus androsaceus JB14 TaxID=1447944 RepID=A0A6A4I437_9AGAR|nr:hypothetical protein BT96DRAFT_990028 [Gymnopus androsaceus JB14]